MNDQTVLSKARFRLAKIEDAQYQLNEEASEIETFIRVFERLVGDRPETAFEESPPEITLPAKTSNAEREGDDSSAPIQGSRPAEEPAPQSAGFPTSLAGAEGDVDRQPIQSDGGAFAAVKITDRLADAVGVEPSSSVGTVPPGTAPAAGAAELVATDALSESAPREDADAAAPATTSEESRERQTAGDNPASKPEASISKPMEPEATAAILKKDPNSDPIPAGKSGEAVSLASPALLTDKVVFIHEHEPDWTARQIADSIGVPAKKVDAAAKRLGIKLRRLSPEELSEARRRGGALGGAAVSNAAQRRGPSPTAQRVIDANKAHPEWTATEIANAVGTYQQNVYAVAKAHGLTVTRVVQRRAKPDPMKFVRSDVPATKAGAARSAPIPSPSTERQPAPAPEPVARIAPQRPAVPPAMLGPEAPFTVGDPDEDYIHPSLSKYPASPLGKKVSLRDRISGFYLHDSLTVLADKMMLTVDPDRAWRGTREQLKNVRGKFPKTVEMVLVAVPVRRKA